MSLFKNIGYLCKQKTTFDKHHRPKISYTEEFCYCNLKDISLTEFYQAQSVGLKPEIKIEVKGVDLKDVTHFRFDDKLYKILRVKPKEDSYDLILTSTIIDNE